MVTFAQIPLMKKILLVLSVLWCAVLYPQVVINEIDVDSPGVDDREFIELKSAVPFFPLDGYVVVLYNGSPTSSTANRSYFTVDLDGYVTDANGIITIGSVLVSPVPQILISANVIQNGEDAVALYLGNSSDFPMNTLATSANLVDALVYGTSDPLALDLMALLGETVQIDENLNSQVTSQSIQRTPDGSYEVKAPTPGANNDGSGFIYNGLSILVSQSTINEGDAVQITITSQTAVTSATSLSFSINNSTFNNSDISGTLSVVIPAGSTSATSVLTVIDDAIDEGDELMMVRFGALPDGFNRLNDAIEVRVIDNDYMVSGWGTPLNPTYGQVTSMAPSGYYASLEGKSGAELRQALRDIIANPAVVREHNYGDIETILKQADQNPLNSNEVWLMYVEQGRSKYKFQTSSSSVGFWNREHIFPQSRGGFADATSSIPDGINVWDVTDANDIAAGHSDAHHLRAEDGPENTSRSNRDYGSDYNGPAGNQGSWKGDVARALFYMEIRYSALSLVNGNPPDNTVGQMGDLASLLEWHVADPADDFEMNRNNVVYQWQQNRNPFIDYPLLVDYIWGANAGQTWSFSLATVDSEALRVVLYPNPGDGALTVAGIAGASTLEVFSIAGERIATFECYGTTTVDLAVPSGFYLAKVTSEGKSVVRKLVVK